MLRLLCGPQGLQDAAWCHGELREPHPKGTINGIRERRHRWHDRHFAHAPHAKGVVGIGHLDDHRVNHREVKARRHAVIQEAGIDHVAILIEVILFIEGPTNALHHTALELTFHITGVNRLPGILDGCVAQDGDFPRLRVHLHVDDMGGNRWAGTSRIDPGAAGDRTAGGILTRRDLLKGQLFLGVFGMADGSVAILDLLDRALPGARRPGTHLPLDVLRRLIGGPAGLKRYTATTGVGGETDGIRVPD